MGSIRLRPVRLGWWGAGNGDIDKREEEDRFYLFVLARFEGIAKGKVKGKGEEIEVGSRAFHSREVSAKGRCGWDVWGPCEKTVHNHSSLESRVCIGSGNYPYSQYAPVQIDDLGWY
jgi:hypothetical protein